jgi:translation initiation factor 3 subunit D
MAEQHLEFIAPELQENATGWGPCSVPEQFQDMLYQPFAKSDRMGKVADWSGVTYSDKRIAGKYMSQFGTGAQYAFFQEEDEGFQIIDSGKTNKNVRGRMRNMPNNRNMNRRGGKSGMQVLTKNSRGGGGRNNNHHQRGGNKWNRGKGKFDRFQKKRDGNASVEVKSSWKMIEEMDYPRLSKLVLPNIGDGQDLYTAGAVEYYDKSFDKTTTKSEKKLQRIDRTFHTVTTTDDPIIRTLSMTHGNVYATDVIVATLMTATRSVFSWDIVVQKVGGKLFFDKREDSDFDLLTVNETSTDIVYFEDDSKNGINSPKNLAMEATFINHNFSQQVVKMNEEKYRFKHSNPFTDGEEDESEIASVGYRYKKFALGDNIEIVIRAEHDAVNVGPNGEPQFMNIKALNEWDSRFSGGIDWRQKLDVQRGAVLANELKNNSCKLAKWTVQALLAGSQQLKFGYVSRVNYRDSTQHVILGTQQFKPKEFAEQINLNIDNGWAILRCIIDTLMKLEDGKFLILKNPNKPHLLIYDIPDTTFESDEEDNDEDTESTK